MQASQSGTASDLLAADLKSNPIPNSIPLPKPDAKLDSNSTRSFPSPFSAPILAARKYFERRETGPARHATQQNGGPQNGDPRRPGASPDGTSPRERQLGGEDSAREQFRLEQETRENERREQERREQDRRLERSLYEGHAIEAGAGEVETRAGEADRNTLSRQPDVAGDDGPEPLFLSASAAPLPDPEAVRGAILRLARGPELQRDPSRSFGSGGRAAEAPVGPQQGHAAALPAVKIEAPGSKPASFEPPSAGPLFFRAAESRPFAARPFEANPVDSQPADFGDVARRVWGAHSAAEYPEPAPRERQALGSAPRVSPRQSEEDVPEVYGGGYRAAGRLRIQDARIQDAQVQDAQVQDGQVQDARVQDARVQDEAGAAVAAADPAAANGRPHPKGDGFRGLDGGDASPSRYGSGFGSLGSSHQPEPAASGTEAATAGGRTEAETVSAAGEGPALAHDACNLLSALALYSELLASPGVLGEQHRHYAEELKLMAGRSQVLIDRLLRGIVRGKGISLVGERPLEERSPAAGDFANRNSADAAQADRGISLAERIQVSRTGAASADARNAEKNIGPPPVPAGAVTSGAEARPGEAPATSLVHLLMRWRSLLSALAHGRLEVVFGEHADAPVPAAAEALERILVNLVRNARAATTRGGAIRIGVGVVEAGMARDGVEPPSAEAEVQATRVQETPMQAPADAAVDAAVPERPSGTRHTVLRTLALTVDDSGCGMTEAQIRRILAEQADAVQADTEPAANGHGPLQTAGEAVSGRDGRFSELAADPEAAEVRDRRCGLGLQIVRQLAAASGGSLSIQSRPGRGTRVEIRWPVLIRSAAEPAVAAIPAAADSLGKVPVTKVPAMNAPDTETSAVDHPDVAEITQAGISETGRGAIAAAGPAPQLTPQDASRVASGPAPRIASQPVPALTPGMAVAAEPAVAQVGRPAGDPAGDEPVFTPVFKPDSKLFGATPVPDPVRQEAAPIRQEEREAVGPDGFSEAELRAMMLRLHRTGPRERAPAGRALPAWAASEEKQPGERGSDSREPDLQFAAPEFGISEIGFYGPAAQRPRPGSAAQPERAGKGAIAC